MTLVMLWVIPCYVICFLLFEKCFYILLPLLIALFPKELVFLFFHQTLTLTLIPSHNLCHCPSCAGSACSGRTWTEVPQTTRTQHMTQWWLSVRVYWELQPLWYMMDLLQEKSFIFNHVSTLFLYKEGMLQEDW